MQPLDRTLRRQLENTIKEAREEAEAGAKAAIEQLGVGAKAAFPHLSDQEKELRRKLRIHGKQLGDQRDSKSTNPTLGEQETVNLVEEVAYEHWHRMLFARFLAENNLLMYPDEHDPVPVTLEECEDLAADEGAANGWELAARFASRMLPQIFRPDSPVFQLSLPPERQHRLERLLAGLPQEVFHAPDALGWVYQFWQAKRKDEVNASEVKIGARELPAVTQLFTEPYMVSFLLDNTLGAWWAGKRLSEDDLANAKSERELRRKASLPGLPLEYLRFVQDEDGAWRPAAGTYEGWPDELSELKVLDPCCGSGHFLVAAFHMLVPMRMEAEGLSEQEAVDAVLAENLHGLEIDKRCTEIAAFALAQAAWIRTGYRALPELQIACTGLAPRASAEEWIELAERSGVPMSAVEREPVKRGLRHMHELFSQAPTLGSLIDPTELPTEGFAADFETLKPYLTAILQKEDADDETRERAIAAAGMIEAADLLAGPPQGYTLVLTNVPYLGRGYQTDTLKSFAEAHYKHAKADLATVFVDRMLKWVGDGRNGTSAGTVAAVTPQNWLFLTSYKKLRERLLKQRSWNLVARLGEHAFESPAAAGAFAAMLAITGDKPGEDHIMAGVDVSAHRGQPPIYAAAKAALLRGEASTGPSPASPDPTAEPDAPDTPPDHTAPADGSVRLVPQAEQRIGAAVIKLHRTTHPDLMGDLGQAWQGLVTGDDNRFLRKYWELRLDHFGWRPLQRPPSETRHFTGRETFVHWSDGNGPLHNDSGAHNFPPSSVVGRQGIAIQRMSGLAVTLYEGHIFNDAVAPLILENEVHLPAIWAFASSPEFRTSVRAVNQKVNVTPGSFSEISFDLAHWQKVAAEKYPEGLPEPQSNDPTQWLFHGHPAGMMAAGPAERSPWGIADPVGTDRHPSLICREPNPADVLQVAVARLLGYRWPAELDEDMRLDAAARAWAEKCDELLDYADDDGIVCLPPIGGEASAADRLHNLLAKAYGDAWSTDKLNELLNQADYGGKTLESWLRDKFFTQHCQVFHQRPFIWHIWDGLKDGFAALVNYHKLDHKNLQTLIYTYLGDWIGRQKRDLDNGVDGAEEKLAAAEALKRRLELILHGEAPYDIFVRWKPLEEQPIGWQPDLNDGVRVNIRPFMTVPDVKKKGAGVLRDKPKIKWTKDRGKEPHRDKEQYPWFWGWDEKTTDFMGGKKFDGNRWNDCHYTIEVKQAAREAVQEAV